MKKTLVPIALAFALIALAPAAFAASPQTANLNLSATVINNCTISTTPVAFGNYDPLSASPNDNSGTVVITCTKNAATTITLGERHPFQQPEPPDVGRYEFHDLRDLPAAEHDARHGLQLRIADPLGHHGR